jgi:hypothetical protein
MITKEEEEEEEEEKTLLGSSPTLLKLNRPLPALG